MYFITYSYGGFHSIIALFLKPIFIEFQNVKFNTFYQIYVFQIKQNYNAHRIAKV